MWSGFHCQTFDRIFKEIAVEPIGEVMWRAQIRWTFFALTLSAALSTETAQAENYALIIGGTLAGGIYCPPFAALQEPAI